jgi:hypothetical protein
MITKFWSRRWSLFPLVIAAFMDRSPFGALAQAPWRGRVIDDPTPIPHQIGEEWLSISAKCIIETPPFLEVQERTETH